MTRISGHIVFDLDGTLIDSRQEILKTYQIVTGQIVPSRKPDLQGINYGASLTEVLAFIYGDAPDQISIARALFASIYDNSQYEETHLYDRVPETLMELKEQNFQLYIATSKRYIPTLRILKIKEIDTYFSGVMANEMVPNQFLQKEEMISRLQNQFSFAGGFMMGDSVSDIIAGHRQHLKTIAAAYGYENKTIFASQNPTHIIHAFDEISNLLKKFYGNGTE